MELKEFIKNSVTAIADATSELQNELEEEDIIINPPVSAFLDREDVVELGAAYTGRRVKNVNFDVAISSETTKEGGTRIAVITAKFDGKIEDISSSVSRLHFSVPISLPPSQMEQDNLNEQNRIDEEIASANSQLHWAGI